MRQINALNKKPEFYNTLIHNCTTTIWLNTRVNPDHVRFTWKLLASGFTPEYLYELDALDSTVTFTDLQHRSHINARAQAADKARDFSKRIRTED